MPLAGALEPASTGNRRQMRSPPFDRVTLPLDLRGQYDDHAEEAQEVRNTRSPPHDIAPAQQMGTNADTSAASTRASHFSSQSTGSHEDRCVDQWQTCAWGRCRGTAP